MAGIYIALVNKIKVAANTIKSGAGLWLRGVARMDNSAARVQDFSENGNNAEANTGAYVDFNGSSTSLTVTDTISGIKTASVWINPDTTTESLFDFDGGTTTIYLSAGSVLTKGITSPTIYVNATETATVTASTWQLVTVTSNTAWTATGFTLGEEAGNYYGGGASWCKLFADALTSDDVSELYNFPERVIPTRTQYPRLLAFFPMMEGDTVSGYLSSNSASPVIVRYLNTSWGAGAGRPAPQTALLNSQLRVHGATDTYVNIPDNNVLDFTSSSDFSIVVKFWSRATAGSQGLVAKGSLNTSYALSIQSGNLDFRGAGATGALTYAISTFTHYTVVATVSGGTTAKLYVNGIEQATGTITAPAASASALQLMGINSTDEMAGFMYYAAIYNKELSTYEVDALNRLLPNEVSGGDLVGYWVNDGATTWVDRTRFGNDGTVNGTAGTILDIERSSGKSGLGLPFSGFRHNRLLLRDSGYISVSDDATLDASTGVTIECWVRLDSIGTEQQFVLKGSAYGLKVQSGNTVRFSFWQTSEKTLDSTTTLTANTWYYLAATYDGSDAYLYINGAQDATTASHSGNIDTNANDLLIGAASTTPTNKVDGDMNNIRVYTSAATALEIARNYRKQEKLQSYG